MKPIWHVPLLVLAGLTAIAGIALTFIVGASEPWPAVEWGLAGASLTFTIARIVHARRVTRREIELIVLAGVVFVALFKGLIAAGIAIIAMLMLAADAKPSTSS